jgi:hypothetical protein
MCLIYMNYILGEIKDELKKRRWEINEQGRSNKSIKFYERKFYY